jgi:hypothetical protein
MDPTRYELCQTVDEALFLLRGEWAAALGSINAIFDCGVLGATPVDLLARALDVQVVVDKPMIQTTADARAPNWRPRFPARDDVSGRNLFIPSDRLTAHREVMLASYILRATADAALKWVLPNQDQRNPLIRDEVDRVMFGQFPRFKSRLAEFGSIEAIHASNIPLQLVGGYLSKHIPSASLESFFCVTPYYGNFLGEVNPVLSPVVRRVGSGPSFIDHLNNWRVSGRFSFHQPRVQHAVQQVKYDVDRLIIAVSRPLGDIVQADTGDALVAVTKAVVWSCGLRDLREVFSRPMVALLQ